MGSQSTSHPSVSSVALELCLSSAFLLASLFASRLVGAPSYPSGTSSSWLAVCLCLCLCLGHVLSRLVLSFALSGIFHYYSYLTLHDWLDPDTDGPYRTGKTPKSSSQPPPLTSCLHLDLTRLDNLPHGHIRLFRLTIEVPGPRTSSNLSTSHITMGSFPISRRRFCLPSVVVVSVFLSIVFIATFLSRPAYLDHLPDVLPTLEEHLPSFTDRYNNKSGKKGGAAPVSKKNKGWKFDTTRDANSYSLDSEQCNIAFPGLFAEIERGVAAQKALGNVTPRQLNISERGRGALRGMIVDQQVSALLPGSWIFFRHI